MPQIPHKLSAISIYINVRVFMEALKQQNATYYLHIEFKYPIVTQARDKGKAKENLEFSFV